MILAKTFSKDVAEKIEEKGFPLITETINRETVYVFALTQELSTLIENLGVGKEVFYGDKLVF